VRAAPSLLRSALYEGVVTHRRATPAHRFSYRVALPLLFLDELPKLQQIHPWVDLDPAAPRRWRPAAMRLARQDFLPGPRSLEDAVRDAVASAGGTVRGPVAMLGHVRTWGWLFNPLTLYYCYDPSGAHVEWTVLEVSNTPWHERCTYVVGPPGEHQFAKAMHISPFLPEQATYTLRDSAPAERVRVGLDVALPQGPVPYRRDHEIDGTTEPHLRATMLLQRRPFDRAAITQLLWAHPLMTARVSVGIYAQALRLALRRAPVYAHPDRARPGADRERIHA